jgi:hypothetical protein
MHAFKYHFWMFQIKNKKLGCSFNEWKSNKIKNDNHDYAIIADCRFPNEVDAVKSSGGYVIKLTLNPHHSTHLSEVSLDPDKYSPENFDLIINNDDMSLSNKNEAIIRFLQDKGMILS